MQTIELFDAPPVAGKNFFAPAVPLSEYLSQRTRQSVEASASNIAGARNFIGHTYHPFIEAVHTANANHWPLVLAPDDIWLCIISAFALHVNLALHLPRTVARSGVACDAAGHRGGSAAVLESVNRDSRIGTPAASVSMLPRVSKA